MTYRVTDIVKTLTVSALISSSFMAFAAGEPTAPQAEEVSSTSVTAVSTGNTEKNTAAAQLLQTRLKTINTFSSAFTQMTYEEDGYLLDEQSGTMAFTKPGKLRWESKEPFSQTLIADGEQVFLYDPDLNQVTVRPWSDDPRQNPAVLFVSGEDLSESFVVSNVQSEETAGIEHFQLRPHESDGVVMQLDIHFSAGLPQQMTINDSLGQKTKIIFTDVSLNEKMPEGHFAFSIPENAEVIWDG